MSTRLVLLSLMLGAAAVAQDQSPLTERERAMLDRISNLERRLAALEARTAPPSPAAPTVASALPTPADTSAPPQGDILGPSTGTTLNLYLDGYYGYNFNRPAGRVNPLRMNDYLSNSFTLNQASLIFERAPDVAHGRRFGARLDLMFGQDTEVLQGSPLNEPRPQAYRNIFQAYGSYVAPIGSGLQVDFGKFYSSLGVENNYAYDEINYSRSFFFYYLPFYHTGFRTTYNVNDKFSVQHWLVNGANQTEDFNGFKSNAVILNWKPSKTLSANFNYYVGQETATAQSGPRLDGRTHIFDTYATWTATNRLSLTGEFDYVIGRERTVSAPSHVIGGAAYAKYQLHKQFFLGGRMEYLGDRGGLFSGATQALKEITGTATYQPAEGVQMRIEWRRDFSNHPFFNTGPGGLLKRDQNTATLGLIWWIGGKKDSW